MLAQNLRKLVREMAHDNPTWGEERIADELKLKLGIQVSPRTIRTYLDEERPRVGSTDQRWPTFVRNHADAIVACDFVVSVTATFRVVYVFFAMAHRLAADTTLQCHRAPDGGMDHPTIS